MPSSAEVRGWARLVTGVGGEVVARAVQDLHRAVSDAGFRWVGPIGRPVKRVHDAVTDAAYGLVRAGLRGAGHLGAAAAGSLGRDGSSPKAVKARAIAHGVVDERLMALAPELDLEVMLHHEGREVPPDRVELAGSYPDATGRLVVFVHGLVDSEAMWHVEPDHGVALPRLAAELGSTPLFVRYGTGRAIGRNGADLAELLEAVVAAWPVPVTQLVVVGHSMGGLMARAACRTAEQRGHNWPTAATDIVYLSTPHLGSWLEKVANVGSWTLRHVSPYSAPIGFVLDGRSRGIKDLRFGTLDEAGWGEPGPDGLLTGLGADDAWLDGVTHHLIVGRLRSAERHPLNVLFGDGFVRRRSATGRGHRRRIGAGPPVVMSVDASHSRLPRHPGVADLLRRLLDAG